MADQRLRRIKKAFSHEWMSGSRLTETSAPSQSNLAPARDVSIEALRGVAILLLVAYHAIEGADVVSGTYARTDLYGYFTFSTENIRMPLFTVISGFLYGQRPLAGSALLFLRGKARRLLWPFLTVSAISFVLRIMVGNTELELQGSDWWRIYLYRFEQFWYLPALMLIFVLLVALERNRLLATPIRLLLAIAVAIALRTVVSIELLNIDGFAYLLPFFLVGCAVSRFSFRPQRGRLVAIYIVAGAGLMLQQLIWFTGTNVDVGRDSLIGTGIGIAAAVACLLVRQPVRWLATIGQFSFPIYLFHIFGVALSVRLVSLTSEFATVGFKIIMAIVVSLVLENILSRSRWSATLLMGTRWPR